MKAAALGWDARIGLREHVYGRLLACDAEVVIEQTARDFFELLVADDFRILRCDFVAHDSWMVEVCWFWMVEPDLRQHVYGRLLACDAEVIIEQTAGDFLELLVADDFRIFRSDFVAHRIGISWSASVGCVAIFDKAVSLLLPQAEQSDL